MNTTIAYAELNEELQELYLASKEWMSDLEFLETDYAFLKKLLTPALLPLVQRDTVNTLPEIQRFAIKTAKKLEDLKLQVTAYLHQLETYITDDDLTLDITFVQTHATLATEISLLKWTFGALRTQVFNLAKEGKFQYTANF